MKVTPFNSDSDDSNEPLISKSTLLKYLHYWHWFAFTGLFALFCAFIYLRYAPPKYSSVAKIRIIDENKELDLASNALSPFAMYSKISLENEMEVIKSYRLLAQVVDELDLDVSYYYVGTIKTREIWSAPFVVAKSNMRDDIEKPLKFKISFESAQVLIEDNVGDEYEFAYSELGGQMEGLPFTLSLRKDVDKSRYLDTDFEIVFWPKKQAVAGLRNSLSVAPTNKKGEILSLSMVSENPEKSEDILNVVIDRFNKDGILDRQLVSKRTLGFIDERFIYLSGQLDSIEVNKKDFKQENDLSYLDEDVTFTLRKKSLADEEVIKLRTQLSLSLLLKQTILKEASYNLLPSDIGLENGSINTLVTEYNKLSLERTKLSRSVASSHPSLLELNTQLENGRKNILQTLDVYRRQIRTSLGQYSQASSNAGDDFSRLPEKEKMLRAIERQQDIKEGLYKLLLRKREEAAINYAVTAPSIKVIDYGLTGLKPVSPKKILVYPSALLLGLLIPFGVLFFRFWFDTKIHERADVVKQNPEMPILGEIPFLEEGDTFINSGDRSILAESFRILATNITHKLSVSDEEEGKVVYVTSAINGEGKTMTALNLSLAYASLKKKVLLVGCDLRNPQLHKFFNIDKSTVGISDYLNSTLLDFDECVHKGLGKGTFHKVCFSGQIPSNPPQLLSGNRFGEFIAQAKKLFDYIIIDTAPSILVTDTILISKHADLTLFVLRAGFTEKKLLEYSRNLNETKKFLNMAYVINNVGEGRREGYNYGYGYGYQANRTDKHWLKNYGAQVKSQGFIAASLQEFKIFKKRIKARFF
ncbi:GumC family protein [Maribacter sp. 2-571]|uniref:GumC family protein n=1 Tax=Maribacter sp. 2-571 TaxID=3417569 RepID=UPI003D32DEAA